MIDDDAARRNMVEVQIAGRGVRDPSVLAAMRKVPRHRFVGEECRGQAYDDAPLPIGYEQTISQPYIVAFMTEKISPKKHEKILEIGTGSGYQTAVLAELAKQVYSVEFVRPLFERAQKLLKELGYGNVTLRCGDGWKGWPEHAPYDKIIVTAAPDEIPAALADQLAEGGRMIVPVGLAGSPQELMLGAKVNGILKTVNSIPVRFVPLVRGKETY